MTEQKTNTQDRQNPETFQGMIKFYKADEGYGFITYKDKDIYFNFHDIKGEYVPTPGDTVTYTVGKGRKTGSLAAKNIKVLLKAKEQEERRKDAKDNRVVCPSCGKKMVPRMSFNNGSPSASYCPFCGAQYKDFSGCAVIFIPFISILIATPFIIKFFC